MSKDFDAFSFKAKSRKNRKSVRVENFEIEKQQAPRKIANWKQMSYRFEND